MNQIEFHPFVPVLPILNFCQRHEIALQGHTILAQGKFFSHPGLRRLAAKYNVNVALILLQWAYQHGIELCLATSKEDHMSEWLQINSVQLSDEDMAEINAYHHETRHRFYPCERRPEVNIDLPEDVDA